jgi:hypothetical protein
VKRLLPGVGLLALCACVLAAAVAPAVAWRLMPPRPLGVVIVDKTVPDTTYRGHRGFVWVLNYLKMVHPASLEPYEASDYVGFVPLTNRAWSVRPFPKTLGSTRLVYVADTYGVTAGDLGLRGSGDADRLLFGGLTAADVAALEGAARAGATLIGEFNTAADPTVDSVRARAERLFGFTWTGWTGRRSGDLESDVPPWAVRNWERGSGQKWSFRGPGLLLAHRDGRVVVLGHEDLAGGGLDIVPTSPGDSLGMRPASAPQGWFDLVEPSGGKVLAEYAWRLTPRGDSVRAAAGLPVSSAAALAFKVGAARSYYLAGDFANTRYVPSWTALRWGAGFHRALPAWTSPDESFFWRGYVPLLASILDWASGTATR